MAIWTTICKPTTTCSALRYKKCLRAGLTSSSWCSKWAKQQIPPVLYLTTKVLASTSNRKSTMGTFIRHTCSQWMWQGTTLRSHTWPRLCPRSSPCQRYKLTSKNNTSSFNRLIKSGLVSKYLFTKDPKCRTHNIWVYPRDSSRRRTLVEHRNDLHRVCLNLRCNLGKKVQAHPHAFDPPSPTSEARSDGSKLS